jgi:ESS family glutamate:Na+ symporter
LVVGYISAWGQYVVGIIVALLVLVPLYDANPLSSMLIAIGFQGGYGTAAGLSGTYGQLGFGEGYDLALGMATAGKVSARLVGLLLINLAVKRNEMKSPEEKREEHLNEDISEKKAKKLYQQKREEQHFSADTLVIHFALLSLAIAVGWIIKLGLSSLEQLFLAEGDDGFMQFIPLFPLALIGGALVQMGITRLKAEKIVNHQYLHSLSHSFLDLLIVVAIATLSIKTITENWQLLLILISSAILWNLFVFFFIAPRFYQDQPWARGVGDFAHATGATTTGLLMMKVVDPTDDAGARSSFNMKQTFYEPIVGGGFITALSLPLVHAIGLIPALVLFTLLFVMTLLLGWKVVGVNGNGNLLKSE